MSDSGSPIEPEGQSAEPDLNLGGTPPSYPPPSFPPPSSPPPPPGAGPATAGAGPAAGFTLNVKLPAIDPEALSKTPWVLGAAAILAGLAIFWLSSIISAFQHDAGYDFRTRVIHLLGPANAAWAVAVLLAVALLVLGSTSEDKRSAVVGFVYQLLLLAAALITVAAAINAIIEITYIGDSFDLALSGFLGYLAAIPISAAAGLWAWRAHPSGLPGKKSSTT
ncbi:MAG: hypothetical protein ACLQVK_19420 [Acidimicrobiales bacterium]|jgi:hypothetical protein